MWNGFVRSWIPHLREDYTHLIVALVGESLVCERKPQNVHDRYNIKYAFVVENFNFRRCRHIPRKNVNNEKFTIYGTYTL